MEYSNGKISESYKKKRLLLIKKMGANRMATSSSPGINCHTEIKGCQWASEYSVMCSGGFEIVYSEDCWAPTGFCKYTLVNWHEEIVCDEDPWGPDLPNGPDDENDEGYYPGNFPGGDSGQISDSKIATSTAFDDGKPKISDIHKYLDCFKDGKQAQSYTMTVFVDQPVMGNNDWFKIVEPGVVTNNPFGVPTGIVWRSPDGTFFDVGHTFVTFEKNNTDGTNVRQTLGFYPSGNPIVSKGAMEDNGGHTADVSYTINVTKEQFEAGLQKVADDFATKDYVLTNLGGKEYNCTDAAISWMNAAGANFGNSTSGLFKNTPGSFGQVLTNKPGADLAPGNGIYGKGPCN